MRERRYHLPYPFFFLSALHRSSFRVLSPRAHAGRRVNVSSSGARVTECMCGAADAAESDADAADAANGDGAAMLMDGAKMMLRCCESDAAERLLIRPFHVLSML